MPVKWRLLTNLVCLIALAFLPLCTADIGPGWNISDDWGTVFFPTPSPSPNYIVEGVGSSLISNLALFAILPVAVGAFVFFIALKGFGQNGDGLDAVLPALSAAVIIVVMTEVCVYVAVFVVNALSFG